MMLSTAPKTDAERFVALRAAALGAGKPLPTKRMPAIADRSESSAVIVFVDGSAAFTVLGPFPGHLCAMPSRDAAAAAYQAMIEAAAVGPRCPHCDRTRAVAGDVVPPTCGSRDCQRAAYDAAHRIEGHEVTGRTYVLGRRGATIDHFVRKAVGLGGRWLRFLAKLDGTGYHVTAYKTLREAAEGYTIEGANDAPTTQHGLYRTVRPCADRYENDALVLCTGCGACRSRAAIEADGGLFVAGPCSPRQADKNLRPREEGYPPGARLEVLSDRVDLAEALAACVAAPPRAVAPMDN